MNSQYIDSKFKDKDPVETVKKIQSILDGLGIAVEENWTDSGVENCYSLCLSANNGIPSTNGKGVTEDFARASAYGEFIERLQGGLFFYKYQSIIRNPEINIQAYAPDGKYVTVDELIADGDWMDILIETYPSPLTDRQSIAEQCLAFACSDDGRILTVPFYSLFEDKYVYLPIGFVDQIYATNGCCVGNTREEAWVHALAEIMERHATLKMLTTGASAPRIDDQELEKYPTVSKIVRQLREEANLTVEIFDYSIGNGFPVVSTRIINKKDHSYSVNVAADPVFEIALQRTLTEMFQGRNLKNVTSRHDGIILNHFTDFSPVSNIINQLETGSGLHTADFFANELTCQRKPTEFADMSGKTNTELLDYMLGLYRQLGKPVYVRNFSHLGFPCYRFIVPGFSEALSIRLQELVPEYAIADQSAATLRNAAQASDEDLSWMLNYSTMISNVFGRYKYFNRISGVPISGKYNVMLASITRAYAAYRLKKYDQAIGFVNDAMGALDEQDLAYFTCVNRYVTLKASGVSEDKIRVILYKFYEKEFADKLYSCLDQGLTPYDPYLVRCDYRSCDSCQYRPYCSYPGSVAIHNTVGKVYSTFVNGQDRSEFQI